MKLVTVFKILFYSLKGNQHLPVRNGWKKFFICPMFKNICDYEENQANCLSVEFTGGLFLHQKQIVKYRNTRKEESLEIEFLSHKWIKYTAYYKEPKRGFIKETELWKKIKKS